MFTQPSVNQIASAYQGNPAPLAQKVNADKKQNGGIPQDLRQLLALNDITQGRNAMGIQQALQTPTNMPTVAQDLQERARQAMQAQMMQAAQAQQQKNGQPNMVPPGTPRPPMQAQGLDALRTNVGEDYAEGGIIGFSKATDENNRSLVQDPDLNIPELEKSDLYAKALAEAKGKKPEPSNEDIKKALAFVSAPAAAGLDVLLAPFKFLNNNSFRNPMSNAPLDNYTTAMDARDKYLYGEKPAQAPAEAAKPVAEAVNPMSVRAQLNAADQALRSQPGEPAPPKVNPSAQVGVNTGSSAAKPSSIRDLLSGMATPGGDYQRKMLNQDEEALSAAKEAAFLKKVGSRDLSVYDQMAQELKARKERLNAPKPGYDAMMEYLGQIAQGGGRNWMEAGSRGAANQNALQRQRMAEQDLLMEKILDVGAKKSEAQFNEKKGLFELTQAEKDKIVREKVEAAKALGQDESKARELAQQEILEREKMANQLKSASIGAHDNLASRAAAIRAENKGMSVEESFKRASIAAGATQMESSRVRDVKGYSDALEKINTRYQAYDNSTDYGRKQMIKKEQEIAEAKALHGMSDQGINALPGASSSGKVPPVGTVMEGYKFKGGNPRDQNNWEKV